MRLRPMWTALVAVTSVMAVSLLAPFTLAGAAADGCPDVEVVFARGRTEPPGAGQIGYAFIDALRARTPKSVDFYAVNYPADTEVIEGANDMSRRIQFMAKTCPNTRFVLGGYSLGAAVTDIVLGAPSAMFGYTNPLPLGMNDKVAAVALFGNGTRAILGPVSAVSQIWGAKTVDLCTDLDPICSGTVDPNNVVGDFIGKWGAHTYGAYAESGLIDQAADFVAARI